MSDMHLSLLCPAHYWATCAFKRDANQSAGAKWMTRNAYACFFWRLTQRSIDCLLIPEEMFSLWAVMEPNAIWVRWHLRSLLRPVCVSPPQNMCTKCGVQSLSRSSPIWLCKICSENKEVRCTEAYECCFRAMGIQPNRHNSAVLSTQREAFRAHLFQTMRSLWPWISSSKKHHESIINVDHVC